MGQLPLHIAVAQDKLQMHEILQTLLCVPGYEATIDHHEGVTLPRVSNDRFDEFSADDSSSHGFSDW